MSSPPNANHRSVSVVIPAFNASRTIERCLHSVARQEAPPLETIVVDGCSTDGTAELARRYARVMVEDCGIAPARLAGARAARGEFIMNVDADQELEPSALRRAVETGADTVAFGESSLGSGVIPFLYNIDRGRMQSHWRDQLDPVWGTIRPRLYRRTVLIRALEAIPSEMMRLKPGPYSEDSLMFVNSGVRPDEVEFVGGAITHTEVSSLTEFFKKWRRYGIAARPFRGTPMERFAFRRARRVKNPVDVIAGFPMVVLRGVPFLLGYLL